MTTGIFISASCNTTAPKLLSRCLVTHLAFFLLHTKHSMQCEGCKAEADVCVCLDYRTSHRMAVAICHSRRACHLVGDDYDADN